MSGFSFTVSLVTYRHRLADIKKTVDGVLQSSCAKFFVIDNSACDELAKDLAGLNDERIEYIPQENLGFGAGHNVGIDRSLEGGFELHFIVNPDIEFLPGVMENIAGFMEKNPEIGMLMPRTNFPDGSLQKNCKFLPTPLDLISRRFFPEFMKRRRMHRFQMQDFDHGSILDVPYLCGCFLALRSEAVKKCGKFDERFFMYPEDIDLTRRFFAGGFRTVYYPEVSVIHAHKRASYRNFRMLWVHIVNMIRYFNKWGWIFDRERVKINRKTVELNHLRRIR